MTLARLFVLLSLDSSSFRSGMLSAISQVNALRSSMGGMGGTSLASLGRSLTYGLTLPILAAAVAIGTFGSKLDSELARVQSVIATPTDSGLAQVTAWRDGIQDLAITLGRSSPEVAGGMYEIVSALGNIPNAMEYLTIAGRAAVAGQSDIVTSTKNLVLATRAWGDNSTVAVQRMADMASQTVKVGTLTESELGPALAGALPIARLYGVRLEEVFASLSALSGVTGSAANVSTQFQRAVTSLIAPNTALTKAYKAMGVASGQALIEQNGLAGALQAVMSYSDRSGVPLQKLLGRIEAVKFAAALTGPQLSTFNEQMTLLGTAAGAVDTAFAGTTQGINAAAFQWSQAGQKLRVIAEDLYQSFAPASLKVLDALEPVIGSLRTLADTIAGMKTENVTRLVYALLGLAALGPTLSIISSIVSTFRGLWSVALLAWSGLQLVGSAFSFLSQLLIPLSVRLLAFGGTLSGIAEAIGAGFVTVISGIATALLSLSWPLLLLLAAVAALAVAWTANWGNIRERTANAVNAIKPHLSTLKALLMEVATPMTGGDTLGGRLRTWRDLIVELGATARDAINSFAGFDLVGQTISAAGAMISGAVAQWQAMFNNARSSIAGFFASVQASSFAFGQSIGAAFRSADQAVSQALLSMANTVRSALIGAFNAALSAVRSFGSGMASAFNAAVSAARSAVASIRAAFQVNWSSIGSSIASGIASGIRAGVGVIASAATSAASAALSAAKSALGIQSPSRVMRDQVGLQIPAGVALGIYNGMNQVTQAMGSLYTNMNLAPYALTANVAGGAAGAPYALAGSGGGGIVVNIENTFNGPVDQATVQQVKEANTTSISDALRRRGLL